MAVRADLERYFRPTLITDSEGRIAEDVAEDLAPAMAIVTNPSTVEVS
jgi:hypothetical protein